MTDVLDIPVPPPPKPAPPGLVFRKLLTAPHLWLGVFTLVMHVLAKIGWLDPASREFFNEMKPELVTACIALATFWTAPRTVWSERDKVAGAIQTLKRHETVPVDWVPPGPIPPPPQAKATKDDTPLPPPLPPPPEPGGPRE